MSWEVIVAKEAGVLLGLPGKGWLVLLVKP